MGIKRKQHKSQEEHQSRRRPQPLAPTRRHVHGRQGGPDGIPPARRIQQESLLVGRNPPTRSPQRGFPPFGLFGATTLLSRAPCRDPYSRPAVVRLPLRSEYGKGKAPTVLFISSKPQGRRFSLKASVLDLEGNSVDIVGATLAVFGTPVNERLINRAFWIMFTHKIQPKGTSPSLAKGQAPCPGTRDMASPGARG